MIHTRTVRAASGARRILCTTTLAVALLVVATAAVSPPASATSPRTTGEQAGKSAETGPDTSPRQPRRQIKKLDEAVADGRLDPDVLEALQAKTVVDVMVTVDQDEVISEAQAAVAGRPDAETAVIDEMKTRFAERKGRVFARLQSDAHVLQDFDFLSSAYMEIRSPGALLRLLNDPDVASVTANRVLEMGSMDVESSNLVRQPQATAAGYTGAGTYVAVLDTGLDYTRSDFGYCTAPNTGASCRVATVYDAAPEDYRLDDNGHGTNVAGIVAGVAPGTRLIGIDVFNGASSSSVTMNSAMNWLISQRRAGFNIVAANLSIWTKGRATPQGCSDDLSFAAARAAGIVPVVISGNGGYTTGVSYPGCIPGALTVGAVYDSNVGATGVWTDAGCSDATTWADKVTCFSQSGPNLKMLAPGAWITAAGITQGGTSQAAPHVAGAIAVMAAAKPSAGVNGWEYALVNSGPAIVDRDGRTRRRLDVYSALVTLLNGADTTAPSVVAPAQSVQLSATLGTSTVPVTINWSASDTSGIAAYELYSSTNGGAWVFEGLQSATATSKVFSLSPGNRYQFTVRAKDAAGNWSGWSYGPAFVVANHAENSSAIRYSTGWTRTAWASAFGGYQASSATTNASATFTFTGRSVAWVATKAINRGQAHVYLDGAFVGTWNLYSATSAARNVVMTGNWATSGTHTLKVVVVGTAGRPTIDVDSFIVLA